LVFVSGNPGRTERLLTMAQLRSLRDVQTPFTLDVLTERYQALKAFAAESAENARIAADDVFGYENALKAYRGRYAGLMDEKLMGEKASREAALREAVDSKPKMKSEYGAAWEAIAKAVQRQAQLFEPYYFIESLGGFAGAEPHLARLLVRAVTEKHKPSHERLREYGQARLPSVEQQLFSSAPIYKVLDTVQLAASLRLMREKLGPDNAVVKQVLGGRSPEAVAKQAIENTRLNDVTYRKHLYEGGLQAVEQSTDPLIVLMRAIDPEARAIRKQWDDEVDAVLRDSGTLIAKARFAVQGTDMYPDATFTLRLSYGVMRGYEQNGETIPYSTTLGGAFEHAARHGNQPPYELPKSWIDSKAALNLKTPYNDVSTPDIIGGNSGSPVVDKKGNVIGIIFDGNIQSLSWDFQYDDRQGRAIHVDTRAIIETLRKIYHADGLVKELMSGKANAAIKVAPAK
jgi:hypothetical protein